MLFLRYSIFLKKRKWDENAKEKKKKKSTHQHSNKHFMFNPVIFFVSFSWMVHFLLPNKRDNVGKGEWVLRVFFFFYYYLCCAKSEHERTTRLKQQTLQRKRRNPVIFYFIPFCMGSVWSTDTISLTLFSLFYSVSTNLIIHKKKRITNKMIIWIYWGLCNNRLHK